MTTPSSAVALLSAHPLYDMQKERAALLLIIPLALPCGCASTKETNKPSAYDPYLGTIEVYGFPMMVHPKYEYENRHHARDRLPFEFVWNKGGTYNLHRVEDTQKIRENIRYIKTFGGVAPTVHVHLVDGRFLVYPETVDDEAPSKTFVNEMMAVTHIYDLDEGKLVYTTEPYQYDHDIPLSYDIYTVRSLTKDGISSR